MIFAPWKPLPTTTILADLLGTSVLMYGDDAAEGRVAMFMMFADPSQIVMRIARTSDLDSSVDLTFHPNTRLASAAEKFFPSTTLRAVALQPISWRHREHGVRYRTPIVVVSAALVLVVLIALSNPVAAALAIPLAAAVAGALWLMLRRMSPTSIPMPGTLQLDGSNLVDYAEKRQRGERPEMLRLSEQKANVVARVDSIRAEFGQLEADIVYRINNSALFDTAVPATERFQMALIAWQDASDDSVEEMNSLAADVEIAYSVARANAETLGLFHLPETARPDGRRAAKAARLALSATNEGERQASRHQLMRILNSLALYYLPDVKDAARAIEGPSNSPGV